MLIFSSWTGRHCSYIAPAYECILEFNYQMLVLVADAADWHP